MAGSKPEAVEDTSGARSRRLTSATRRGQMLAFDLDGAEGSLSSTAWSALSAGR